MEVPYLMTGETGQRWRKLCVQAAVEQDPNKLLELVAEINKLLWEKEQRLRNLPTWNPRTTSS